MRKFDIVFVLAMRYKNDSNPPHKHSGNSAAKTLVNQECKKHDVSGTFFKRAKGLVNDSEILAECQWVCATKAHENQYRRK